MTSSVLSLPWDIADASMVPDIRADAAVISHSLLVSQGPPGRSPWGPDPPCTSERASSPPAAAEMDMWEVVRPPISCSPAGGSSVGSVPRVRSSAGGSGGGVPGGEGG